MITGTYKFTSVYKMFPTEGNLVYEYNPFRNYRLSDTKVYYKNRYWTLKEIAAELGMDAEALENGEVSSWQNVPASETPPIVYQKGQLVDFETDQLGFSLNNPVNVLPQYSYDNSVNLIINDGLNAPRLINSRFSATERNRYQICDRKGNNDTNIYDEGEQFDIDSSLYKKMNSIPELEFVGVSYGGNLKIGNYHFYFRYIDDDGNMSDFFAESGLVSLFIGNTMDSTCSGFRDENSHKVVKFTLSKTDEAYQKVLIYYTRATSESMANAVVETCKINRKYQLAESGNTLLTITGYEEVDTVDSSEINPIFQIYGSVETQDQCQNMLFLANVDKPQLPYEDLEDCALRILPYVDDNAEYPIKEIKDYSGVISNTYYDPTFIYNKVGYYPDEIYRFGVVFILSDNTLSEVFNIRGTSNMPIGIDELPNNYYLTGLYKDSEEDTTKKIRTYIQFDEQYYNLADNKSLYENARGVVKFPKAKLNKILGINFFVPTEVKKYLMEDLKVKGLFFVRQKRIPTALCQALTIGIDNESHTPVVPVSDTTSTNDKYVYKAEGFLTNYATTKVTSTWGTEVDGGESDKSRILTNDKDNRIKTLSEFEVSDRSIGAICPEYDVNFPYLNSLFTGSEFKVQEDYKLEISSSDNNLSFTTDIDSKVSSTTFNDGLTTSKIIGVEDNTKLVGIGNILFSARAGEAEEAFRFEYVGNENISTEADNFLRGSFGPYLGITGYTNKSRLITIKIPGYSTGNMQEYFEIRYHDKSPYYPISYRMNLSRAIKWLSDEEVLKEASEETSEEAKTGTVFRNSIYRGDCYICQFTHRLNRNFQDPSAPINDKIVDKNCWKDNYEVSDGVVKKDNFENINLGDVNAVKLGMYITFFVRSSINLNIRALDGSMPDEVALTGHARGFYPYYGMTNNGAYKTPEALCYNKGFEKSLSEKIFFEVPDVPWIKNEFSNRIAYSNVQVKDAFENGWRTFPGGYYRDYPKTYGSITKIVELRGNLICVFEHGVALIPVNERTVSGEGSGGNVYINTNNVLPMNPKIISDKFGSQWRDSVIKTPRGIYGVDTIGKKIWRTDGNDFELISDFRIQEFLNNNISLTERELTPIIGVRNVKSHYNAFKNDVMFTFYDNLYGFEEKVWNICFNESLNKWITFYSWVPSYSENIYNQYFSFDRNTSKWVAKLGTSTHDSDFADGVTVDEVKINGSNWSTTLHLDNRTLPTGDGITNTITYILERDNYGNYKKFAINGDTLTFTGNYSDLTSEFYARDSNGKIKEDERGRRIWLDEEDQVNPDKVCIYLNIKAQITTSVPTDCTPLQEAAATGQVNLTYQDAGYYESVLTLIPEYNMQFLTTDFWKHGQAGIIDIADTINPCYWYGKQHPFEFEFVVAADPDQHKIFDNLQIISNSAEPESFHYEITGDCYEFADDKKNMYIRQEATKELYQYNEVDVTYDHDYTDLKEVHRPYAIGNYTIFDKSTILPLWYARQDKINEIEDYYHLKDGSASSKDFSAMAGGEIVRYWNLDEFRIWNHAKAVDITGSGGRLRGNMQYKENKWNIQINPINLVQKNESAWSNDKIPIELGQSPLPSKILEKGSIDIPTDLVGRDITNWNWATTNTPQIRHSEAKIKDKWVKIRIRYKGDKLAIISAIRTLYSISYA